MLLSDKRTPSFSRGLLLCLKYLSLFRAVCSRFRNPQSLSHGLPLFLSYPPRVIHQFWEGEEGWTKWSVWRATVRSMATRVIYPFWAFLVEIIEMAHCPGCDASRPIRGECLVNAKVRRGLGLVPCLPKSPKAIHTLGIVVCRIINYKGTLVFERGAIYATTFLQRSKIGKVGVSLFISKVYL